MRQLGGALGRAPEGCGALGHLDAGFGVYAIGVAPVPPAREAVHAALDSVFELLHPYRAPWGSINFTERPVPLEQLYAPDTVTRLREVKRRYDPNGLFRSNHPIEAQGSREA
jgi:FAD/FMN-containing dehydrogenase